MPRLISVFIECMGHFVGIVINGLNICLNGPTHQILVLIAYAQKPPLNPYSDISRRARGLKILSELSSASIPCVNEKQRL